MQIKSVNFYNTNSAYVCNFKEAARKKEQKYIKPDMQQINDLRVFYHHIYEYKKGLRSLVLTTEKAANRTIIEAKLQKENIPYIIKDVNSKNINVFFGNKDCIRVVSTFNSRLDKITPEQDFMLGIMLGYDKILQCKRYFIMRDKFIKRNMKNKTAAE